MAGVQRKLISEFTMLYEAITGVKDNIKMFRTVFEDLKLTMDSLQPLVKENVQHDISHQLEEKLKIFPKKMQDGVELVHKCSKLSVWSTYKKYRYIHKLIALEKYLRDLVDVLRIQAMIDAAKTWNSVNNAEATMVKEMTYRNREPELPYFTVGLDEPLKEVKKKLISEDKSVLVLTGAGGCGKTTLATTIYFDDQIKAFPANMSINVPVDLLREIVKHCRGHPLTILVVGRSLCGKPIEIWRNTLFKWSKGYSILDYENDLLFSVLQSSLEDLGKENSILLESFLDLTSFPDDQAIHVPVIFDIWAQLYDLCEDSMCNENLYKLTTRSLVDVVVRRNVEEDYSEHFVTQHDMLRSLAIHHTGHDPVLSKRLSIDIRGDTLPKWWTEVTEKMEKPKKVSLLSISTDEAFSTKWPIMQLPVAEVLVLNLRTKNYDLPKFIRDMHKTLKVLIVQNYGSVTAEISHFHWLSSLSNLKTIRLHRISVPSLSKNPTYLKSLQKISFFMCNISQAFGKDAIRISRALPLVVEISIDYCRDLLELQDDICNLVHLKKLSITNCHRLSSLPEKLGKLTNLEVLSLRACSDLVKLPSTIGNLKKLNFLDISHCFSIKELPEEIGALSSLRKLNMRECSRLQELPESFSDLQELEVVICDKYTKDLWELFTLRSTEIRVVKEQFDLQWLQRLQL
ncbi:hypothetical protein ACLB2K_003617 [Fragaria x ananassa]